MNKEEKRLHHNESSKRWQLKNPTYNHEHYLKNKKHYNEQSKIWWGKNKDKAAQSNKEWRKNNPEKCNAHNKTRSLRERKNWTSEKCALCDSNIDICIHHENYNLPYSIIFLCRTCHNKIHRRVTK